MSALDTQIGGSHYRDMPVQPIEAMRMVLTPSEYAGYLKGCILKYSMRAGHKANTDDAGKARHYMQFLREFNGEEAEILPPFPTLSPANLAGEEARIDFEDSQRGGL